MADPETVRTQMCVKLADFAKQIYRDASLREHRAAVFREFEQNCKAQLKQQQEGHQRELSRLQTAIETLTAQIREERSAASQAIR